MYTDAQNRPSFNQSIAAAAGTIVSTDSIDMLASNRNLGRGSAPMRMVVSVTAALVGGTSIQAQLIESANSNLSSPTVLASGPVVPLASAVAGAELLDVPMPDTAKRYLGVQYVTLGTFTTGGTVSAVVVAGSDRSSTDVTMNTGL